MDALAALRAAEGVTDWVHRDTVAAKPLAREQVRAFYQTFFQAFPDLDFEVTRTIVAEEVVVLEWLFSGSNHGPLLPPAFTRLAHHEPTGKTAQLRGVSVLDLQDGQIERETVYLDQATLLGELGVRL